MGKDTMGHECMCVRLRVCVHEASHQTRMHFSGEVHRVCLFVFEAESLIHLELTN